MYKHLFIIILIIFVSFTAHAQTDPQAAPTPNLLNKHVAPVAWERYKVSSRKISVLLPKLPSLMFFDNPCFQMETESYFAYADQAVYEMTIFSKNKKEIPQYCEEKRQFGRFAFESRLAEIRAGKPGSESKFVNGQREGTAFEKDSEARWIIDDLANDGWIEMAVHFRADAKADKERYISSLDLSGEKGIEIGNGSNGVLGDKDFKVQAPVDLPDVPKATDELTIVARQKPSYTDSARRASIVGKVVLRVVFLSNGAIGSITPVETLSHGLTEQAMAAARKIVFLPKRVNGVPVNVSRPVVFTFSIY